jgi:glycosyltransferase involved in cell wall biosynthesis
MSHITIVLPVKNEAANLPRCIEAVSDLGRVVVVDSGSSDDTQAVAKAAGAEVLNFEWDGQFPKKRNWTLRNYNFKTEWVLFLDADEFVSSEFIQEVQAAIEDTTHVGFWLNFSNHFMGQKLKGGDAFRKLALFRLGAGEYEKIDEGNWSHLDMEVHEHPVLEGSIGEIHAPIEHNDFRGLKHYIGKHNEYSSWEAARYLRLQSSAISHQSSQQGCAEYANLTERQKKKYRNLAKWWFAPAYFVVSYFLKKGFLDGALGFHFSLLKAVYFYQIRLKIREALVVTTK